MWVWLLTKLPGISSAISAALNFVVKHWKFFAIAGMIGLIFYQNEVTTRFVFGLETIPHLKTVIAQKDQQIKKLTDDLHVAVKANQDLTTSIKQSNDTVGQWKAISEALAKKNEQLQQQLVQMRRDNDKKVSDILHGKTPTTCEDSIQFLRDIRSQLTW